MNSRLINTGSLPLPVTVLRTADRTGPHNPDMQRVFDSWKK
jgi:hypothetical protein